MRTPEEYRKLWIERLRSGEKKQIKGTLHAVGEGMPDGYCCLGVIAELLAEEADSGVKVAAFIISIKNMDGLEKYEYGVEYHAGRDYTMQGNLNVDCRALLGLSWEAQDKLITMNDKEDKDFNEIADYIETLPMEFPKR